MLRSKAFAIRDTHTCLSASLSEDYGATRRLEEEAVRVACEVRCAARFLLSKPLVHEH